MKIVALVFLASLCFEATSLKCDEIHDNTERRIYTKQQSFEPYDETLFREDGNFLFNAKAHL